jgi:Anti-sigma-K factor rskA.
MKETGMKETGTNETNINDDALRWQLRALRKDVPPQRDLWPDIAARIASTPQQAAVAPARRRPRWMVPVSMAASLLLAVGLVWQGGFLRGSAPADPLIRHEAAELTGEYKGALKAMPQTRSSSEYAPALRDLDRSAAKILVALEHDPDARFLLEQLRRTYARRLALTQRAALT